MRVDSFGTYETASALATQRSTETNEIQRSIAQDDASKAANGSGSHSRDLIPIHLPAKVEGAQSKDKAEDPRPRENTDGSQDLFPYDVRRMSPREAVELGQELYMEGVLGFDEYSMLAFQPELHPDYDKTVGALTGEPARPDKPRDFVQEWEEKVSFQQKHNTDQPQLIARTERILSILKMIDNPTDLSA